MKNILISLVILCLVSCVNSPAPIYKDAPTQFIVKDIVCREGMKNMSTYYIEVIDVNNLVCGGEGGNLKFYVTDTIGKYKLGEPIHFDKQK